MAIKGNTLLLYRDIHSDYEKFSNIKEFGVQKFNAAWIFGKLGKKYYKSPRTIENIVFSIVL